MVVPELADAPVILPVIVPIVHAKELAALAVRPRLVLAPLHIAALVAPV